MADGLIVNNGSGQIVFDSRYYETLVFLYSGTGVLSSPNGSVALVTISGLSSFYGLVVLCSGTNNLRFYLSGETIIASAMGENFAYSGSLSLSYKVYGVYA